MFKLLKALARRVLANELAAKAQKESWLESEVQRLDERLASEMESLEKAHRVSAKRGRDLENSMQQALNLHDEARREKEARQMMREGMYALAAVLARRSTLESYLTREDLDLVIDSVRDGRKIEAIKVLRNTMKWSGWGLRECKTVVDEIQKRL